MNLTWVNIPNVGHVRVGDSIDFFKAQDELPHESCPVIVHAIHECRVKDTCAPFCKIGCMLTVHDKNGHTRRVCLSNLITKIVVRNIAINKITEV